MLMLSNILGRKSLTDGSSILVNDFDPFSISDIKIDLNGDTGLRTNDVARFVRASNQRLNSSASDLLVGDIDFTIAGWVYHDTVSTTQRLFTQWSGTSTLRGYSVHLQSTNIFRLTVGHGSSATSIEASTHGSASAGQWYFVCAWHDSVNNTINIQINNGTVDSAAHSAGVNSGSEFIVGGQSNDTNFMNGRIGPVMFWKRVLTTDERTWLYNSGDGRDYSEFGTGDGSALTTSLTSYWRLNETASGKTTRNDSHGTNHLTDAFFVGNAQGLVSYPSTGSAKRNESPLLQFNSPLNTTATINGPVFWKDNGIRCANFDGSDDYIDTNLTGSTFATGSFQIFILVKLNDGQPATDQCWFGSKNAVQTNIEIYHDTSGKINFKYGNTSDGNANANGELSIFPDGTTGWILGMFTYDSVARRLRIRINGVDISLTGTGSTNTIDPTNYNTDDNLYIGARNNNGTTDNYLDGFVHSVLVYDRVLEDSEIEHIENYFLGNG